MPAAVCRAWTGAAYAALRPLERPARLPTAAGSLPRRALAARLKTVLVNLLLPCACISSVQGRCCALSSRLARCAAGMWQACLTANADGSCTCEQRIAGAAPDSSLSMQAGGKPVLEMCGGTELGGSYLAGSMVQPQVPSTFSCPTLGAP